MAGKQHYLRTVIRAVDRSHPHLGNGVAVAMVAAKCGKLLMVIAAAVFLEERRGDNNGQK